MKKRKRNKRKILLNMAGIILTLVVIGVIVVIVHDCLAKKRAGEFAKYENWRSATIGRLADYCDIDLDKVDKVDMNVFNAEKKGIGYIVDGERKVCVDYSIFDEEVIDKLVGRLKDVKAYGVWDDIWDDYEREIEWSLKFYVEDMDYSLVIVGDSMESENAEALRIQVEYSKLGGVSFDEFPDPSDYLWSFTSLIYDEELIEYVYELRESCVKNLDVGAVLDIYDKNNMELFYAYENDGGRMKEGYEIFGDEIYSLVSTFPIDDFDGYVKVEKQNEGIEGKNGYEDYICHTDIVDVKLYNNAGDSIDIMNTTKEALEDFLR